MSLEGLAPGHHRLLLEGTGGPSGSVTPTEMRLRLSRTDEVADAFAHVHEAHHLSLNSSTAWGSLLHVVAAGDGAFGVGLGVLVDECRLIHESYATYAAVSVIEARFGPQPDLLVAWPDYAAWMDLIGSVVANAGGPQRRYLLATALARVCMQAPVAEVVIEFGPERFVPSMLRTIDRPDGRFRMLAAHVEAFEAAAVAGDRVAPRASAVDVFGAESVEVADERFDELWLGWEQAAYEALAGTVDALGGRALTYNGHQAFTEALIDRVEAVAGPTGLRGQRVDDPVASDLDAISSVLVMTHEELIDVSYRARPLEPSGNLEDLVELVAERSRIADVPVLVLSLMLPEHLEAMYRWDADTGLDTGGPVRYGVRLIETDESGGSAIVWLPIDNSDLDGLVEAWASRGPAIALVRSSCLLDPEFQHRGLSRLQSVLPTIVVADVPPDRLIRSWSSDGEPIQILNVRVEDASGLWRALVFVAVDDEILWLVVGTEATVGLYRQALETVDVTMLALDQRWQEPLHTALTTMLALETSISFDGAETRT